MSLRCFSHEMLCHEMVSDNVVASVGTDLLTQEKSPSQAQLKSPLITSRHLIRLLKQIMWAPCG